MKDKSLRDGGLSPHADQSERPVVATACDAPARREFPKGEPARRLGGSHLAANRFWDHSRSSVRVWRQGRRSGVF